MKSKNLNLNRRKTAFKGVNRFLGLLGVVLLLSSCTTSQMGMADGNAFIWIDKEDLTISDKVTAEAQELRIIGIDFSRLFKSEEGNFDSRGYAINPNVPIPLIGSKLNPNQVQNYALHKLLVENPDYDVVLYPRFQEKTFRIPLFFKKTETMVSARLGKL